MTFLVASNVNAAGTMGFGSCVVSGSYTGNTGSIGKFSCHGEDA
jgi:hypothetical protein